MEKHAVGEGLAPPVKPRVVLIGFLSANRKKRLARLYSRLLLIPKILLQSKIIFGIYGKTRRRGGACSSRQIKTLLGGLEPRHYGILSKKIFKKYHYVAQKVYQVLNSQKAPLCKGGCHQR